MKLTGKAIHVSLTSGAADNAAGQAYTASLIAGSKSAVKSS